MARTITQVAFQTEPEKFARNGHGTAHRPCRGPPKPPPVRYHTAKTQSCPR